MSALVLILMVGCTFDPDPGQSGEELMSCSAVSTTEYALDDATNPLGFAGQAIVDLAVASHAATFTWAKDGSTTDLTLDVTTAATTVLYRDMEWQDDGSGAEIAMAAADCPDDLQLAVTVGFTTADGAFAESWDLDLSASSATEAYAYEELDLDALAGSYTVTEVDPSAYDAVRAFAELGFDSAGPWGVLDGQAEDNGDASDPDSVASAEHFAIGEFGVVPE